MRKSRAPKIGTIVFLVLLVAALTFWLGGQVVTLRSVSTSYLSHGRFEQLRFLLLRYHEEHGHFPPIEHNTEGGGLARSWRVLLLPYIDTNTSKLYLQYDFLEPWNSPGNLAVMQSLSPATNPFSMNSNAVANYLTVGEGDNWPSEKPLKAWLVAAGEEQFLVVEYPDSEIYWTEPAY